MEEETSGGDDVTRADPAESSLRKTRSMNAR